MNDEQVSQIETLLKKSELNSSSQEMLRNFFNSLANEPQFPKIMDLLQRFPSVFDNFCKCFQMKQEFLSQGKSEKEWNELLKKEEDMFERLEKKD